MTPLPQNYGAGGGILGVQEFKRAKRSRASTGTEAAGRASAWDGKGLIFSTFELSGGIMFNFLTS